MIISLFLGNTFRVAQAISSLLYNLIRSCSETGSLYIHTHKHKHKHPDSLRDEHSEIYT